MSVYWNEFDCVQCRKPNVVNNGDVDDMTLADVDGFKCWCCGTCNMLDDCGNVVVSNRDEEEHDEGFPTPYELRDQRDVLLEACELLLKALHKVRSANAPCEPNIARVDEADAFALQSIFAARAAIAKAKGTV